MPDSRYQRRGLARPHRSPGDASAGPSRLFRRPAAYSRACVSGPASSPSCSVSRATATSRRSASGLPVAIERRLEPRSHGGPHPPDARLVARLSQGSRVRARAIGAALVLLVVVGAVLVNGGGSRVAAADPNEVRILVGEPSTFDPAAAADVAAAAVTAQLYETLTAFDTGARAPARARAQLGRRRRRAERRLPPAPGPDVLGRHAADRRRTSSGAGCGSSTRRGPRRSRR